MLRAQESQRDGSHVSCGDKKMFPKDVRFAGWELPTSYGMTVAVRKGINRARGNSEVRPEIRTTAEIRNPLMSEMLITGLEAVE